MKVKFSGIYKNIKITSSFSPNEKYFAFISSNHIEIKNIENFETISDWPVKETIIIIKWSPNSLYILALLTNSTIQVIM